MPTLPLRTETLHRPGYRLDLTEARDFLRARVYGGADTAAHSLDYWRVLGEILAERGMSQVLVIEELDPFPEDDRPEVFEQVVDCMAASGFGHVRVAFVDTREEVEANELALLLGVERGLTIMMFSTESAAIQWLRYGSAGQR